MIMFCGCDKYKFKVVSMTNDQVIIHHCKKRVQLLFFFFENNEKQLFQEENVRST